MTDPCRTLIVMLLEFMSDFGADILKDVLVTLITGALIARSADDNDRSGLG